MATTVVAHTFPCKPVQGESVADAEVRSLASWIRARTKRLIKGDQNVDFRQFKRLLEAYGVEFGSPNKNFIKLYLDERSVRMGYPSEHFTVPVSEVKRVRRALGLDYTDRREFYDLPTVVDEFVYEYRDVLCRLADE